MEKYTKDYLTFAEKIGRSQGWTITNDDDYIHFQSYTNGGQDCNFDIELFASAGEFIEELWDYYENFDVSAQAYMWLDGDGHGRNGAPYEMIDVYNDMKEYRHNIFELWSRLNKAFQGAAYIYLDEHTDIITGDTPIDMNNVGNESTAIEYKLPDNFSEKAKKFWAYLEGAAFIFEYESRLVITDESLYLTEYEDGNSNVLCGAPRWIFDSWKELEEMLENCYDDYGEDIEELFEPDEIHTFNHGATTFMNNGWKIVIILADLTAIDLQEIYDYITPDRINWNNFETGDDLWYADGSKSIKVKDKNEIAKTIWFGK